MTDKERLIKLIDEIPDYKVRYALAYVQGLIADEEADDAFCEQMYQDYLNDPDPDKDKFVSAEELNKELGLE